MKKRKFAVYAVVLAFCLITISLIIKIPNILFFFGVFSALLVAIHFIVVMICKILIEILPEIECGSKGSSDERERSPDGNHAVCDDSRDRISKRSKRSKVRCRPKHNTIVDS